MKAQTLYRILLLSGSCSKQQSKSHYLQLTTFAMEKDNYGSDSRYGSSDQSELNEHEKADEFVIFKHA